jgi:hypothetical protein
VNPGIVAAIVVGAVVLGVVGYFAFGILFKLLWGWWPAVACCVLGCWATWELGFEYIWMLSIPILGSVVGSWQWQRTTLFLRVDDRLEKMFLMCD